MRVDSFSRRHRLGAQGRCALLVMALAVLLCGPASAQRCIDEEAPDSPLPNTPGAMPSDGNAPRLTLQAMVQEALRRSNAVGAARLLAEAAASEIEEARAARLIQASVTGTVGYAAASAKDTVAQAGGQAQLGLTIGAPLYDSGRIASLTGWRTSLAEAARQGQLSAQEQIALQTVSLALERHRHRQQARVYQQFSRKMACLAEVLDQIVKADRGRASELVQARKTLAQAELAQSQSVSQWRQAETKLKRFIGDAMPSSDGLTAVLLDVPALLDVEAQAARASEIAQLDAQAKALESFSRAAVAAQKPQLNWVLTGSKAGGGNHPGTVLAGISLSMPLLNQGADHGIAAAQKRAEAAKLQRTDALEARKSRIAEVHEQAAAAVDRARQTSAILRDTNQVRNFTLQQWQQLARRSLFDVMSAESEHYNLRVAYINALHDGQQASALLRSLGLGISAWLE
jgi:outer membrane protein, adhesin transport system